VWPDTQSCQTIFTILCNCTVVPSPLGSIWVVKSNPARETIPLDQGRQIFLGPIVPKREKYTKWAQTISKCHIHIIPNGYKIYQHFPFQLPPKYNQIGIFGLEINHLATLHWTWPLLGNLDMFAVTRISLLYMSFLSVK
jgi:hypothetical protein